jgi:hypothetical protein
MVFLPNFPPSLRLRRGKLCQVAHPANSGIKIITFLGMDHKSFIYEIKLILNVKRGIT